jgi:hypothetical protein
MEAKLNNSEIIVQTLQSQAESKRVYKQKRVDAAKKAATAKKERDENRKETIMAVEGKPYIKMVSFYDNEKASLLNADSNGYF